MLDSVMVYTSVIYRWPTLCIAVISVTVRWSIDGPPLYRRDFSHGRWPIDGPPSVSPWFQSRSVAYRWPTLCIAVISVTVRWSIDGPPSVSPWFQSRFGGQSMAHPLYRRDFSHGRWPIDDPARYRRYMVIVTIMKLREWDLLDYKQLAINKYYIRPRRENERKKI